MIINKFFSPTIQLGKDLDRTATLFGIIYILTFFVNYYIPINFIIFFFIAIFTSLMYLISEKILNNQYHISLSLIWLLNALIFLL